MRRVHERDLVLAASALSTLNAANAVKPFDRRHAASVLSFSAGWPTSELPFEALAAHLALTGVAAARGDLRGWRGVASGALSAATASALFAAWRTAHGAADVYEAALQGGLGQDYRDEMAHPGFPGPDGATTSAPGVLRMLRIRRRFAREADVSYGPARRRQPARHLVPGRPSRRRQRACADPDPRRRWVTGNKQSQAYPLMSHLAERGWICVALSYRLSPPVHVAPQIVDVKRAIAWVKEHIAGYGGDPAFVALTGGSAGGHLSSLAALTPGDTEWQPGFEDADTSVAACVPFYGVYDWTGRDEIGNHGLLPLLEKRVTKTSFASDPDLFERASPMWRIHEQAPPFLISHGVNDSLVPVEEGRLFAERLHAASAAPVVYADLPGAQHAFDIMGSPRANAAAEATARFLGVIYGRYLAAGMTAAA